MPRPAQALHRLQLGEIHGEMEIALGFGMVRHRERVETERSRAIEVPSPSTYFLSTFVELFILFLFFQEFANFQFFICKH